MSQLSSNQDDCSRVQSVNVQEIIMQIQTELAEGNYLKAPLSFEDVEVPEQEVYSRFDRGAWEECMHMLNCKKEVPTYWQLRSNRKIIGSFLVFMRKVIRKVLKFYIGPIVYEQNQYNAYVARSFQLMVAYFEECEERLKTSHKLEEENRALRFQLDKIKEEQQSLATKIQQLQGNRPVHVREGSE